ncbi:MAG TPA: (2Fe-2S)-binding protein [Bacteroidota bacterium]|nr:(2Fe-2S)-binding protein [Bacteroidota bacterium]
MKFSVNGKTVFADETLAGKRLVDFLREDLGLTGTKNACDIGACGACTILINDEPMKICTRRLAEVEGAEILTIEGMARTDGTLHPLQEAFISAGAVQCGFCTPGMILTAHAFLLRHPNPTRDQIRRALYGNLCRCTGYQQIVDAVESVIPYYQEHALRSHSFNS